MCKSIAPSISPRAMSSNISTESIFASVILVLLRFVGVLIGSTIGGLWTRAWRDPLDELRQGAPPAPLARPPSRPPRLPLGTQAGVALGFLSLRCPRLGATREKFFTTFSPARRRRPTVENVRQAFTCTSRSTTCACACARHLRLSPPRRLGARDRAATLPQAVPQIDPQWNDVGGLVVDPEDPEGDADGVCVILLHLPTACRSRSSSSCSTGGDGDQEGARRVDARRRLAPPRSVSARPAQGVPRSSYKYPDQTSVVFRVNVFDAEALHESEQKARDRMSAPPIGCRATRAPGCATRARPAKIDAPVRWALFV